MAAGTRRIRSVFAGASTKENILSGTPLEYPGVASTIEIACAALTGQHPENCTMDVMIGTDMIAEGLIIPLEDVQDSGPRIPENVLVQDVVAPADHVQIRLVAAAAGEYTTLVRIQPV